jgi:hypothetical protein
VLEDERDSASVGTKCGHALNPAITVGTGFNNVLGHQAIIYHDEKRLRNGLRYASLPSIHESSARNKFQLSRNDFHIDGKAGHLMTVNKDTELLVRKNPRAFKSETRLLALAVFGFW